MLTLTRKHDQSVVLRLKGTDARRQFTVIDLKPQTVRIRWDDNKRETSFDTGQPLSFLFCGRRVTVYVVKVQGGLGRLQFDAPADVLIDRAERLEETKNV